MTGLEGGLIGLFGIFYLAMMVGAVAAIVLTIQALRRIADAQEEATRTLQHIARHLEEPRGIRT